MSIKSRETWIDSIKGIATILIVFTHSGLSDFPGIIGRIARASRYSVMIFYILSTYVCLKSYDYFLQSKNKYPKTYNWYKKRFLSLLPPYFFFLIIYILSTGGNRFWLGSDKKITVLNITTHFILINGIIPKYTNSIIGVEWYMSILFVIILITPLLHKYIKNRIQSITLFLFSILAYYIHIKIMGGVSPYIKQNQYIFNDWVSYMSFIPCFHAIALGTFLYHVDIQSINDNDKKWLSYISLVFVIWVCYQNLYGVSNLYYFPLYTTWSLFFFIFIVGQRVYQIHLIDNPIFKTIGKNCYIIYLGHPLVYYYLDKVEFLNYNHGLIIKFVVCFIICYSISIIFTLLKNRIKSIRLIK